MRTKKVPTIYDIRQLPAILTVTEVASLMRRSTCDVRHLCASGHIPAEKLGSCWRISKFRLAEAFPCLFGGSTDA